MAGTTALAPAALASGESAGLSTLAPNSPVSGTASSTAVTSSYPWIEVDFPLSHYTQIAPAFSCIGSACSGPIGTYGLSMKVRGSLTSIASIEWQPWIAGYMSLYLDASGSTAVGDVTTVSWGEGLIATGSSGAGPVQVWYSTSSPPWSVAASVTPTIYAGDPPGETPPPQPPPTTYVIGLNPGVDATCATTQVSAFEGTWVNLPTAIDCTAATSQAGATLLGWASDPGFPTDLAQRHVDLGGGAFDGLVSGQRMIFIPTGGQTFVTGDNTLYGIWSK